jgi:hypothetical protein
MSAKPPLVISRDMENLTYHFTNTSDKTVHGIKVSATKDGKQFSTVIIDTIKPHETASVDLNRLWEASARDKEATITCVDYSKPIKLYQ